MGTKLTEVRARGGVAKLFDNTFWRIAPLDLPTISAWPIGDDVTVESNDSNMLWPKRLTHQESRESVGIVGTQVHF